MKKFTKQADKLKEVLLSYSNRKVMTKAPDMWVLWYRTPDFNEFEERLRVLRRTASLYGVTKSDRDYCCKTFNHLHVKTAERYPMYLISITLWKADNGEAVSQRKED